MQSYTYSTVCVCLFDATKNREKKLATICSVITCVAVVRAWEISCPQKPPNCRYSIYRVEIYHIFAFESFGRQTASAASSGIKALHKYERQLLGYRGTSAFVRVFLSVAVQIVCLCECVLVNGCSNSLSWGSLSGAVKWQERDLGNWVSMEDTLVALWIKIVLQIYVGCSESSHYCVMGGNTKNISVK